MSRRAQRWRQWTGWAIGFLLLLDGGLLFVNLRDGGAAGQAADLAHLRLQRALLGADVQRARQIREQMPEVQKQCDRFFTEQLRPAEGGYSAVVADLGQTAGRAGLRISSLSFKQKEKEDRGVTEIEVSAVVEGDYPSLVRFINGLERSRNFYLIDTLGLASSTGGGIKLNLELRTYFRS